ncbi:MAG TPA: class I SAM-dependent methyltransferase [Syntrophales bacterium]|nr:class I SAM-dependent methyltransferase [Syntrophales bacterium]HRR47375.1 class I SAM-dependent methyltransferase [Syntrophales bacterium]
MQRTDTSVADLLVKNIKGFLHDEEAIRLYELAGEVSRHGPCLEIGSYCGKSAAFIGLACRQHRAVLFSIDHHRGSEEQQPGEEYFDPDIFDNRTGRVDTFPLFRRTMEELQLTDTVVPIVAPASLVARAWRTPLSFVFIDGSHTLAAAYADYSAWASHLLPGGVLAIHDIFFTAADGGQAPHLIYRLALASGLFSELPMTRSLGVLRKTGGDSLPPPALAVWEKLNR